MTAPAPRSPPSIRPFRFVSYGVRIEIDSNEQEIIDQAEAVSRKSLLGNIRTLRGGKMDHLFELTHTKGGTYRLIQNGERISHGRSRFKFFKFFDTILRVSVAEYAKDRVFLHAGVVGWKGRAILMPADSFKGKTTLVSELVRNGAEYYSDDFAVIDAKGLVHPFARPLSMRTDDGKYRAYELSVAELGGTAGHKPIPVGMVLFTEFVPGKVGWRPRLLTPGQALMELIQYTLPMRRKPAFSVKVLNSLVKDAVLVASHRGQADRFAKTLLRFGDKWMRLD